MARSRNKKGMYPWFPAQAGKAMRRSKFLEDTSVRAYFGPGHKHDVVQGTYYCPTDWRPAGAILTGPQVVWLNVWLKLGGAGDSFSTTWRNFYPDTRFSTSVAFHVGVVPWFFGDGPYTTVEHNVEKEERLRVLGVYAEVKARVEALRRGKTWVEVIDWNDATVPPASDINWDGFLPFAAPPDVEPGSYFGTAFLNVWAGQCPYESGGGLFVFDVYTPETPLSADHLYGNPRGRVARAYDAMQSYGSWFYGSDVRFPAPSPAPATDAFHVLSSVGPTQNISLATGEAMLSTFADDMSDLGTGYRGGMSTLDADALVVAIAAHFRFSPTDGKDLP